MGEPRQLTRGKRFQRIVQDDFLANSRDGKVVAEERVSLAHLTNPRHLHGRMDIFIGELGDFVTILEIKATDWDRIKRRNIRRNLWRHQRQLFTYIDKFLKVDDVSVCHGIIYPRPPKTPGLRDLIETLLDEEYGVPAYWYSEIRSPE